MSKKKTYTYKPLAIFGDLLLIATSEIKEIRLSGYIVTNNGDRYEVTDNGPEMRKSTFPYVEGE